MFCATMHNVENESIQSLHKKYIKGTAPKFIVVDKKFFLCNLTNVVKREVKFTSNKVYITTKMLKHIYDKKPAELYDFIVQNLYQIVKYPDHIYKNKSTKRGDFCFVKLLKNEKYLPSIEVCAGDNKNQEEIYVATVFRTDEKYLEKYELLWSWRDDIPSS